MQRNPASISLICLVSLITLSCRSTGRSEPSPPADNVPTSDKPVVDKPKDKTIESGDKADENTKPQVPQKPSEKDLCEQNQLKVWDGSGCVDKVLDANTLFDPAFHCVRKPSGAYADCKPIPREGIDPIRIKVASVTDSNVALIKDLTFASQLTYSYLCEGAPQLAYLKLGKIEHPLVQEEKAVSHPLETPVSFKTDEEYELLVKPNSFSTISGRCRITISSNQTVVHATSRALLQAEYAKSQDTDIKLWAEKEQERIKDSDADYAAYLKTFK